MKTLPQNQDEYIKSSFFIDQMLENLRKAINSKVEISEEELSQILPFLVPKKYDKNDFFLKEGEYCHYIGFLNKGLIRTYIYNEGKELTTQFVFENCFFTYLEGLFQQIPAHKNFIALEPSDTLLLKISDLPRILETNAKFERIFRHLLFDESILQIKANETERKQSPTERYILFQKQFPTVSNRVSIKHIASFLGIEPQSLSRIRKHISKSTKVT